MVKILKVQSQELLKNWQFDSGSAVSDLTVKDLVEMAAFHRNWFGRKSMEDDAHVEWALGQTNMLGMRHRLLSTLSGGKDKAWIAMALAQRPQVLYLMNLLIWIFVISWR